MAGSRERRSTPASDERSWSRLCSPPCAASPSCSRSRPPSNGPPPRPRHDRYAARRPRRRVQRRGSDAPTRSDRARGGVCGQRDDPRAADAPVPRHDLLGPVALGGGRPRQPGADRASAVASPRRNPERRGLSHRGVRFFNRAGAARRIRPGLRSVRRRFSEDPGRRPPEHAAKAGRRHAAGGDRRGSKASARPTASSCGSTCSSRTIRTSRPNRTRRAIAIDRMTARWRTPTRSSASWTTRSSVLASSRTRCSSSRQITARGSASIRRRCTVFSCIRRRSRCR